MKLIKHKLTFLTIALSAITIQGQEITANISGGLQGLNFKTTSGDNKIQAGGRIGFGYTYFINENWGVLSGIDVGYYSNKASLANNTYASYLYDSENDLFEYRVKTTGYKEKSHFYAASIPVLIQYRTKGNTQFYVNAGGRVFFPFSPKAKVTVDQIETTGYYPDFNAELNNMPQHGFTTSNNLSNDADTKLKVAFTLSAETGVSFKLSETLRLYTGLYVDYGLNNMQKKNQELANQALVSYDATGSGTIKANGLLNSNEIKDKTNLLAYGAQIKLGFDLSKKSTPIEEEPVQEITVIDEVIVEEVVTEDTIAEKIITEEVVVVDNVIVEDTITEEVVIVKDAITEEVAIVEQPITKTITEEQQKVVEESISYNQIDNTKLSEADKTHLNQVASILQENPDQKIEITGHTCDIGTNEINMKIGFRRAQAVADYIETKGVQPNQIEIKSEGDKHPKYPNTNDTNRQKNRRVSIEIIK